MLFVTHFCFPPSNEVNATDQEGNTALHVAALSSKVECMRVLLRAGGTESLNVGEFIAKVVTITVVIAKVGAVVTTLVSFQCDLGSI